MFSISLFDTARYHLLCFISVMKQACKKRQEEFTITIDKLKKVITISSALLIGGGGAYGNEYCSGITIFHIRQRV